MEDDDDPGKLLLLVSFRGTVMAMDSFSTAASVNAIHVLWNVARDVEVRTVENASAACRQIIHEPTTINRRLPQQTFRPGFCLDVIGVMARLVVDLSFFWIVSSLGACVIEKAMRSR